MARRTIEEVCREFDLDLVVLFGSRAKGCATPESDSDVAVRRRRDPIPEDLHGDLAAALSEATGLPEVDLVDLRRASPLLLIGVATDGRALFEAEPGTFNLFRVYAWKLWLDDEQTLRKFDVRYLREAAARWAP